MDAIDAKIVECLKANARENASVIGGKVNMSVSAIIERIKKMETLGIIESYTITLNQRLLGNDLIALMDVSLEHPKYYDAFVDMVKKIKFL